MGAFISEEILAGILQIILAEMIFKRIKTSNSREQSSEMSALIKIRPWGADWVKLARLLSPLCMFWFSLAAYGPAFWPLGPQKLLPSSVDSLLWSFQRVKSQQT